DLVDLAEVAPRDDVDAPRLAEAPETLEHLGEGRSVAVEVDPPAPVRAGGGDRLVVADVADGEDQSAGRGFPGRLDMVEVGLDHPGGGGLAVLRLEGHPLDDGGRALALGPEREPPDARLVGRQPQDVAEVRVRPPSL